MLDHMIKFPSAVVRYGYAVVLCMVFSQTLTAEDRPNILFIFSDCLLYTSDAADD